MINDTVNSFNSAYSEREKVADEMDRAYANDDMITFMELEDRYNQLTFTIQFLRNQLRPA